MPKFNTTIADKTHSVLYTIKPDETLCIIKVSGDPLFTMPAGQAENVLRRLRAECVQHHAGTLFAWQRDRLEAYTLWSNGVDFKEYFKIRAEEGGSLVLEISAFWEYCQGAKDAAMEPQWCEA